MLVFPGGACGENPPANAGAMQEAQILSLGWEDPLEEGIATHSEIGRAHV